MSYRLGQWGEVRKGFRRHFHAGFGRFYDGMTTFISGRICINLPEFDRYLHSMHGEYEERGLSMKELIIEKYGREAWKLINELT
jgi:hypothetical protein